MYNYQLIFVWETWQMSKECWHFFGSQKSNRIYLFPYCVRQEKSDRSLVKQSDKLRLDYSSLVANCEPDIVLWGEGGSLVTLLHPDHKLPTSPSTDTMYFIQPQKQP